MSGYMIAGENDTYVMPCIRNRVRGIRLLIRGKNVWGTVGLTQPKRPV